MASTKEMQRRAKQARKPQKPAREVSILAIRHTKLGQPEFVYFKTNVCRPKNDKSALLRRICTKDWVHTPPAGYIAEYLFQTNSFAMFDGMGQTDGYVINFYESDYDRPDTYSCRDIIAGNAASIKDMADDMGRQLAQSNDYSVKTNHTVA